MLADYDRRSAHYDVLDRCEQPSRPLHCTERSFRRSNGNQANGKITVHIRRLRARSFLTFGITQRDDGAAMTVTVATRPAAQGGTARVFLEASSSLSVKLLCVGGGVAGPGAVAG